MDWTEWGGTKGNGLSVTWTGQLGVINSFEETLAWVELLGRSLDKARVEGGICILHALVERKKVAGGRVDSCI